MASSWAAVLLVSVCSLDLFDSVAPDWLSGLLADSDWSPGLLGDLYWLSGSLVELSSHSTVELA